MKKGFGLFLKKAWERRWKILGMLVLASLLTAQVLVNLAYFGYAKYAPFIVPGGDYGSRDFLVQTQADQDLLVSAMKAHGLVDIGMDDTPEHRNVVMNDGTGVIWIKKSLPKELEGVSSVMTLIDEYPSGSAIVFVERLRAAGHEDANTVPNPVKSFKPGLMSFVVCPSLGKAWCVGFRKHYTQLPTLKPYAPGK